MQKKEPPTPPHANHTHAPPSPTAPPKHNHRINCKCENFPCSQLWEER